MAEMMTDGVETDMSFGSVETLQIRQREMVNDAMND